MSAVRAAAAPMRAALFAAAEREKYEGIYSTGGQYANYGHSNHGAKSSVIWDTWNISKILDVGCGHNEFAQGVRSVRPWIFAMGADFACPSADVLTPADKMPFGFRQFDLLTAFDMLEHLLPGQVADVLQEFNRVSKAFVLSVAYRPSVIRWQGANLHPTVRPESWWMEQLFRAGARDIEKLGRYIYGRWKAAPDIINVPPPVGPDDDCVLVGNGPAVLQSELGGTIDAFTHVVRFNAFKTVGFEKHVGSKTTLWSTFGKGVVPQDEKRPERVLYLHGTVGNPVYVPRELWRLSIAFFNEQREAVRAQSPRPDKGPLLPSSGYTVAMWLLSQGVKCIHLAGFNHFDQTHSNKHHYWRKSAVKLPTEHDGQAEAELFAPLVQAGRVKYLTEPLQ